MYALSKYVGISNVSDYTIRGMICKVLVVLITPVNQNNPGFPGLFCHIKLPIFDWLALSF